MNEIPLVQNVQKNDINTSIIAIKKQLKELNAMLGLIDTSSNLPDMSPYIKKTDIVNEVQRFNLNPVTSNAVSQSISYSTSEEKTGGYWIDGKPIYRRVFTGLNFGGGTTGIWNNTGVVIADIETIVEGVGLRLAPSTSVHCVNGFFSYGIGSNGNIQYYGNHTLAGLNTLIVEYTKTTDQPIT